MQVKSKSGRMFDIPDEAEAERIHEAALSDPDAQPMSDDMMKQLRPLGRPKAAVTKERVTIRLSPEVTAFFRAGGQGWQTRLDEALKAYVASKRG
jgi:uncharacterized protein (DUF4415 family)